uniref:Uncharacterized protein n=1 Tax=Cacopsylla melanoneura TaxID=428564 RepID=A0A8D8Z613_9HEMI
MYERKRGRERESENEDRRWSLSISLPFKIIGRIFSFLLTYTLVGSSRLLIRSEKQTLNFWKAVGTILKAQNGSLFSNIKIIISKLQAGKLFIIKQNKLDTYAMYLLKI